MVRSEQPASALIPLELFSASSMGSSFLHPACQQELFLMAPWAMANDLCEVLLASHHQASTSNVALNILGLRAQQLRPC